MNFGHDPFNCEITLDLHVRVAAYPYIVVIFPVLLSSMMVEENRD